MQFNAMKMKASYYARKAVKSVAAPVAASVSIAAVTVGNAHAAIDASVGTAFTALQADAVSLSGIVIPIVVAVLGLGITISLIKRFGKKI